MVLQPGPLQSSACYHSKASKHFCYFVKSSFHVFAVCNLIKAPISGFLVLGSGAKIVGCKLVACALCAPQTLNPKPQALNPKP